MKHFAGNNFRGILCCIWGRFGTSAVWKQAHKDTSFILSDNIQFMECVHVHVGGIKEVQIAVLFPFRLQRCCAAFI